MVEKRIDTEVLGDLIPEIITVVKASNTTGADEYYALIEHIRTMILNYCIAE